MSCFMALLMSGLITAINQGWSVNYASQWMHAYSIAWPIAFGLMFMLRPLVMHIVGRLVDAPEK